MYKALKDHPPADAMACAERPAGFDGKAWAVMPENVRRKLVELMGAFRSNADRHDRLVNYLAPGTC